MNIDELANDSDTSDEDYVPSGKQEDAVSEVDSDGDPEEPLSDSEDPEVRGKKRKKKTSKTKKKSKRNEQDESGVSKENEPKPAENDEDQKKKVDDLWADFMKDTGFTSKTSRSSGNGAASKPTSKAAPKTQTSAPKEKVKVTQIFEFAGEEVTVEKEVAADSAEARLLSKAQSHVDVPKTSKGKRGGLSGISNVLSQLGKKPKISTLEKTKLDWDKFKKEENIEEELQTYNKGKDGYLDRQDFLQRADLRRFEIEKDIRTVERNKRFNNTL